MTFHNGNFENRTFDQLPYEVGFVGAGLRL